MAQERLYVMVTWAEAQKLLPVFKYYMTSGQWREVRKDAQEIYQQLSLVRNIDYGQLGGMQLFLTDSAYEFLQDVRAGLS
jgi:hypothetical protein